MPTPALNSSIRPLLESTHHLLQSISALLSHSEAAKPPVFFMVDMARRMVGHALETLKEESGHA